MNAPVSVPVLLRENRNDIAVLTLNRPDARNSLSEALIAALTETLRDIADDRAVTVEMTLTTPNCPSAQELPTMVENAVASVPGVGEVKVNIVWDPPWDPSRMSEEARAILNMW